MRPSPTDAQTARQGRKSKPFTGENRRTRRAKAQGKGATMPFSDHSPLTRRLASQERKRAMERTGNPIMAKVRSQVRSMVEACKPRPVQERNREAMVSAIAHTKAPGAVYQGTASASRVAAARRRTKTARASRRANR